MSPINRMKQNLARLTTIVALAALVSPAHGWAQQLNSQQMRTSLGRVAAAAPAIDLALLQQQVSANVGKGVSTLPDWSNLGKLSQIVVDIQFQNNSVAMEPESYRMIGLIADALHHPNLFRYKFLIVGHSSSTGDAKKNLTLSQQRADAIKLALSTTFAVPEDSLYAIGVGQEWPIDPSDPAGAVNRRVQLINLGLVKKR